MLPVMDSSQVSWQKDVTYEELLKKCPYLTKNKVTPLESHPSDLQVHELTLSKSKKKRLKRRLKNLTANSKCQVPDEVLNNKLQEQSSSVVSESHSTLCSSKVCRMEKEPKTQELVGKQRVPDVVDGEILASHPKVNRDQILSERDARKKAKQLNKLQKKVSATNEQLSTSVSHSNNDVETEDAILNCVKNDIKKGVVKKEVVKEIKVLVGNTEGPKNEKDTVIVKSESNVANEKVSTKSIDSELSDVGKVSAQKSREDVKAEREAKKKAKQLAKLKKGGNLSLQNESSPPTSNVKSISPSSLSDVKVEIKSHETKPIHKENEKLDSGKSKAELKAERRAKQEAQRAAKELEKRQKLEAIENKENKAVGDVKKSQPAGKVAVVKELKSSIKPKNVPQQRIKLFGHLHVGGEKEGHNKISQSLHPSILELGVKYSARVINGSNARCVALLNCLKEVITDYTTPLEKEFSRGLESKLAELTNYINQCRPMAVSMTNALRHIKSHLTQLPNNVSDDEAKRKLCDVIDTFIREQIDVAGEAICESVKNKILNGDVILIYSCSSLLYRILTESHKSGREFRVVVVDGGPWFEGREMLRRLVTAGLNCTYVQVSAISFIMKQVTKVLLGAHALLANGCVMSRAGAAIVALSAHSYNVPVLVCCETYKFCERVQTDAFVYNELGNPDDIVKEDERLNNWQSSSSLSLLNLVYDITPPDLVTAVVTEIAILPCTSVPVILRVKPSDVVS